MQAYLSPVPDVQDDDFLAKMPSIEETLFSKVDIHTFSAHHGALRERSGETYEEIYVPKY